MEEHREYTLFSPAKVNIGLSVVGRRENGYHELESLFWPLNFGDEIKIKPADETTVSTDIAIPEGENIVEKIFKKFPSKNKYQIKITKKIPMGAGLGGGSSNAGTVLKFLVEQGELSTEKAKQLAISLGADVPFFLDPCPSWVTGIGENIEKLPATMELYFLLILIPEHSSTKEVFTRFKKAETPFSKERPNPFKSSTASFDAWCKAAKNDLEHIVSENSPTTREIINSLRQTSPLYAALSGSGSTCFGIYANSEDREKAFKVLLPVCRKNNCRSITAETHSGEQQWKSPKLKFSPSTKTN